MTQECARNDRNRARSERGARSACELHPWDSGPAERKWRVRRKPADPDPGWVWVAEALHTTHVAQKETWREAMSYALRQSIAGTHRVKFRVTDLGPWPTPVAEPMREVGW